MYWCKRIHTLHAKVHTQGYMDTDTIMCLEIYSLQYTWFMASCHTSMPLLLSPSPSFILSSIFLVFSLSVLRSSLCCSLMQIHYLLGKGHPLGSINKWVWSCKKLIHDINKMVPFFTNGCVLLSSPSLQLSLSLSLSIALSLSSLAFYPISLPPSLSLSLFTFLSVLSFLLCLSVYTPSPSLSLITLS